MAQYPDSDSLPAVPGQAQGNAWGFWGAEDELGALNYLTPEVILAASREVKAGISVQLDLPLDFFSQRVAGREGFKHEIVDFKKRSPGTIYDLYGHDDVLAFNTQSSSQWDGFRHIAIQESATYYQGMKHEDIIGGDSDRLGTHKWVERGGVVGRGVLLDYHRWREQTGKPLVPANSSFSIKTDELDQVIAHQGLHLRPGDILLLHTGFTAWYHAASPEERAAATEKGAFISVESSMVSVKWLWNHHFAALAKDTLGFECTPIAFSDPDQTRLHDWLLGHWATPIGELWDLERLSGVCAAEGRWSFLLTSAPLHVKGGVASTSNAIAIL